MDKGEAGVDTVEAGVDSVEAGVDTGGTEAVGMFCSCETQVNKLAMRLQHTHGAIGYKAVVDTDSCNVDKSATVVVRLKRKLE